MTRVRPWSAKLRSRRPASINAVVTEDPTACSPAALSTILWKQRQLLDLLQFKLEEERLLLANGPAKWVAHATREVEMVVDKLRQAELARAATVAGLAGRLGLPADATLQALADTVEAPWQEIFASHRQAFLQATDEISRLAETSRELATSQRDATRQAINWLAGRSDEPPVTYGASGSTERRRAAHLLFNEAL